MSGSGGKNESLLTGGPDALKLDPSIKTRLDEIEHRLNSMQLQQAYLNPDFKLLQNLNLRPSISGVAQRIPGKPLVPPGTGPANLRRAIAGASQRVPGKPLVPRGKGPPKPRTAYVGDLMSAVTGLPVVKQALDSVKDQVTAKLHRDWRRLPAGGKAGVISVTTLIAGGTLAGLLARKKTRRQALEFIQGKDIPAPGVAGLSMQVSPLGRDKRFVVNLDLAVFLRSLSNK